MLVEERKSYQQICHEMSRGPIDRTHTFVYCQGEKCMAWRWSDSSLDRPSLKRRGYCGKVGKPLYEV